METRGTAFVRTLPSAAVVRSIIIPDELPAADREDLMNALAQEGSRDPIVRRTAMWLANRAAATLGRQPTETELAQAVLDGEHELVQYDADPENREEYNRAVTTLSPAVGAPVSPITRAPKGRGDCDDMAILYVAMCLALGLSSEVLWFDVPRAEFNHVATAVCLVAGQCRWVETTLPGARIDEAPFAAAARLGPGVQGGI